MDKGLSWDLPSPRKIPPHNIPTFFHNLNLLPNEMQRNLGSYSSAQLYPPACLSFNPSTLPSLLSYRTPPIAHPHQDALCIFSGSLFSPG